MWTNNALVAAMCMILGVTIIGTIYFLAENVVNLGVIGGAMLGAGKAGVFWGLILPHGLLELTAVFVSAGVGMQLGWAWIAPGPLSRGRRRWRTPDGPPWSRRSDWSGCCSSPG